VPRSDPPAAGAIVDSVRLNPLDRPGWDDLLLSNPGRLEALLPVMDVRSPITGKRGVSIPFTDDSSPVVNGVSPFF